VHAVDLPGHGLSPQGTSPTPTLRDQVELLKGFCTQVLSEPALVVGNSLGGALSMQLASETPEHVRALGLLAPAGARVDPARQEELLRILKVVGPDDARRVTSRLFHRLPLAMRLLAGQMQSFYGTATVHALIEDAAREGGLSPELLGGLLPPVLLCWGESERLLPFEGLAYFRAHLPAHARIELLPGTGHVPQVEVPQVVIARLCRFADELGI
jgi:pimeloyl-ACP methyl ester carboxylesterase